MTLSIQITIIYDKSEEGEVHPRGVHYGEDPDFPLTVRRITNPNDPHLGLATDLLTKYRVQLANQSTVTNVP